MIAATGRTVERRRSPDGTRTETARRQRPARQHPGEWRGDFWLVLGK